jgi:pimeloyl-ACP methyl ester carboxylesterase
MTLPLQKTAIERGDIAGVEFLRRPGSGAGTLVLLHGIGSNARSFEPLMSALDDARSLLAWNAPGYGGSRALPVPAPTPRNYADALKAMLDRLEITSAAIVGHSLGCLFAASFAATYPERVRAVALLSPALGYRVAAGAPLPPTVQSRIDEIESLGPTAFAAKRAARLVGEPDRHPHVVEAVRSAMAQVNPAGYAQAVRALGAGDLLSDIARITGPALVAVGSNDVITPPDNARTACAAFPRAAAFHEVAGAGHAMPQEQPDAVARLLSQLA